MLAPLSRARSAPPVSAFRPLPLATVFLSLIGRPRKSRRTPVNPDWEREEPLSGLS